MLLDCYKKTSYLAVSQKTILNTAVKLDKKSKNTQLSKIYLSIHVNSLRINTKDSIFSLQAKKILGKKNKSNLLRLKVSSEKINWKYNLRIQTNSKWIGFSHKYLWHVIQLEEKEAGLKSYSAHSPFHSRIPSIISLTSVHLVSAYIFLITGNSALFKSLISSFDSSYWY